MHSVITLDARIDSDLQWSPFVEESVDWFVDLGLFAALPKSLDDEMQFKTLELGLKHFRDHIWERYADRTKQVCLYKGSADFSKQLGGLPLVARDQAANFLRQLSFSLPDEVPLTLELDISGVDDLLLQAQLLSRECFDPYNLVVKGAQIPLKATGEERVAVCLPEEPRYFPELQEVLIQLRQESTPYRIIPEAYLTMEWDGLDKLFVSSDATNYQCERKVQGFVAAGGEVIKI